MGDYIKLYTLIGHAMYDFCIQTKLCSFKIKVDLSIPSIVYYFFIVKSFKILFVVFCNAQSMVLCAVTTSWIV